MTEASAARPSTAAPAPDRPHGEAAAARHGGPDAGFADLHRLPVAEHVAVFDAEHARLQQELSGIDQL